jgi:hypothetical protein
MPLATAAFAGQRAGGFQIVQRQHATPPGVFQRQHLGAREVRVDRLDRGNDFVQRQRTVGVLRDRLRLDGAQHRRAAAFPAEGVRIGADQVFVAAFAVRHQAQQVGLRAGGHEQPGLETQIVGQPLLQRVDRGIFAVHVVADVGYQHGLAHGLGWLGDGIAA